jgi:LysR family glycine cleavage system transcriptional activator
MDRETPPQLPPLTALRSFEAAARHLSFTRAAGELSVTQAAVSHQVKLLEGHVGTPLFRRLARRIVLTQAGQAWAAELCDIFARLHDAHRRLRTNVRAERPVVTVSVIPSLAARWLVPRLGRFLERHPDCDVRISATAHLADFGAEAVDLGIRYGKGVYPGLVVDKLADDALVVVASPELRSRKRLVTCEDLRRHVLLHDDAHDAWGKWLSTNGVRGVDARRGTVLTDSSMLVEATVRGQGVGLARWSLAMDDLSSGRLVQPFPRVRPMPTGLAYYIALPKENLSRPAISAFRDWLLLEAKQLVVELKPKRHLQGAARQRPR